MKPFTKEDLDRHEKQLEDYPDVFPKYETLQTYINQIRQLMDENERLREENNNMFNHIEASIGIDFYRELESLRGHLEDADEEISQIQADKSAAVELLWEMEQAYSDFHVDYLKTIARKIRERLEGAKTIETTLEHA